MPDDDASLAATYTQTLAQVKATLDRILILVEQIAAGDAPTPAPNPPVAPPVVTNPTPAPVSPLPPVVPVQTVYWINQSQGDLTDQDAAKIVQALTVQAVDLVAAWPGLQPVIHVVRSSADAVPPGGWKAYWLPNSDVAGALGYHDVDPHGDPYSRVYTRYQGKAWPALVPGAEGITISNISSHEACELVVDPSCTVTDVAPDGKVWSREACDVVEAFAYDVTLPDGTVVSVSDFVTAAFFGRSSVGPFDHIGAVSSFFTIAPGGYSIEDGVQVLADKPSLRFLSQQGSPAGRTARRIAGR